MHKLQSIVLLPLCESAYNSLAIGWLLHAISCLGGFSYTVGSNIIQLLESYHAPKDLIDHSAVCILHLEAHVSSVKMCLSLSHVSNGQFMLVDTCSSRSGKPVFNKKNKEKFRCYEAQIEESEKTGSRRESNPGHLACAASALPLSYDNRTTTSPHNPLYVVHGWD